MVDAVALDVVAMIVVATIVVVILLHGVATAEAIEAGAEDTPRTSCITPTSRDFILALHGIGCLDKVLSSFHQ